LVDESFCKSINNPIFSVSSQINLESISIPGLFIFLIEHFHKSAFAF